MDLTMCYCECAMFDLRSGLRQWQFRSIPNLSGVCLEATSAGRPRTHHKEAVRHMCLEASRLKQRARTNWKPASSQATGSQPIKECSARGNSPFMGGCLKSPTRLHGGYSLRSFLRMLNGLVRMQDIESCHFEAKHEIFAIT